MPILDGISMVRKLREFGYSHPIIGLSADYMMQQEFQAAGAEEAYSKPLAKGFIDQIMTDYQLIN
eukprot:gene32415-41107_t